MSEKNSEIYGDGSKRWYNDRGQFHRIDGPAYINKNGSRRWYQNDKLHRTDGPAVIYKDHSEHWYQDGHWHRTDGPARTWVNGAEEWWINGEQIAPIPNIICVLRRKLDENAQKL